MKANSINIKKIIIRVLVFLLFFILFINVFVVIQAYSFMNFKENSTETNLSVGYSTIFTGVDIPKPKAKEFPNKKYETVHIPDSNNQTLEAWILKTPHKSKGIIILFHGFRMEKSAMLDRAYNLLDLGYDTMLLDFRGAGNSYGTNTTIGYYEAENVKQAFEYAENTLKYKNIYLYGFSMGSAAVAKAQHDYNLAVSGIILEAPYGKMLDAVKARLGKTPYIGIPFSYLMTFWGGVINGYNAFSMNPDEYVKSISVPVLFMCGGKDPRIPLVESKRIFNNIKSNKKIFRVFPNSNHESYLLKYPDEWKKTVKNFVI